MEMGLLGGMQEDKSLYVVFSQLPFQGIFHLGWFLSNVAFKQKFNTKFTVHQTKNFTTSKKRAILKKQRVPHYMKITYAGLLPWFLPMYTKVGDFCISRGPPKVPLTHTLHNLVFRSPKNCVIQGPSVAQKYSSRSCSTYK